MTKAICLVFSALLFFCPLISVKAQDSNDLLLFAYSWTKHDDDAAQYIKHEDLAILRDALEDNQPSLLNDIKDKDLKLVGQAILTKNQALLAQITQKDWARFATCALNYKAVIKREEYQNQDFYYLSRFVQTGDPDYLQHTAYLAPGDLYDLGYALITKEASHLKQLKNPCLFYFGTALLEVNMFKLDAIENNNFSLLGKAMVMLDDKSLNQLPYPDYQHFARAYIFGQPSMLQPINNVGLKCLGEALIAKNVKLLDQILIKYDEDPISYTGTVYTNSDLYYFGAALVEQNKAELYNIEDEGLASVGFAALSKDESYIEKITSISLQYMAKYMISGDKLHYGMINNQKWYAFCKALDTKAKVDVEAIPDATLQLVAKAIIENDVEILEQIENVE